MNVTEHLCCFALRQVMGEGAERLMALVSDQFSDRSQALTRALTRANLRAWRALEIALAGESIWNVFDGADEKALRKQLKAFIDAAPLPDLANRQRARSLILTELLDARKHQLLTGTIHPANLGQPLAVFTRFHQPQELIAHERELLRDMARLLKQAGYDNLAWLLAQPASASDSLVVVAAQYFFRREVERDERLAHALQFAALETLAAQQRTGFDELELALAQHDTRLEQALVALQTQLLTAVNRVEQQVAGQSGKLDEIKELQAQVLELVKRLDMHQQTLRPRHSLSIRSDREKQLVRELLARFRAMPTQQQEASPSLLDDLGKLLVAAGEFGTARETFERAAKLAPGEEARAEAYFNAYRAALEQGDLDCALRELLQATALDPVRFAPFPLETYEMRKILGAGGFGVTFLARHRHSRGEVAIKALFAEELDRDVGKVFAEAATLEDLKHPCIVRLRDCNYADTQKRRPYLIMDYFPGITLEEYVRKHGPLEVETVRGIALSLSEAMAAAHSKKILHRDIKPANVLIRIGSGQFEVRLIDFGLALRHERLEHATASLRSGKSLITNEIAGTLGYAAPEQLGRLPGVKVGPAADIYGFGRTMAYALFGVPEPTLRDYRKLPETFAELLSQCMSHAPEERPRSFQEIQTLLQARPRVATPVIAEALPVVPTVRTVLVDETPGKAMRATSEEDEDERPRRSRRDHEECEDHYERRPAQRPITTTTGLRITTALCAWILGMFGTHKFIQGNVSAGIVRLLISFTCIGVYLTMFVGFIEAIVYLCRSNESYEEAYIRNKQGWF
jgi:serine/threonine protein kinase/TM2 domain-containing membrane protein YozV/tetratricopeptide (TPR) repeat protein